MVFPIMEIDTCFQQKKVPSTYFHFSERWENVELYRYVLRSINIKYGTSIVATK